MLQLGYFFTLLYVFFLHSHLLELLVPSLSLNQFLAAGALSMAILSGAIVRPFKHRVGIGLIFLVGWHFLGVPFSSYPSGALTVLLTQWPKNLALFVMVVALVNTRRRCARMLFMIGLGSTAVSLAALTVGSYGFSGRLILSNTSLGDPNELAMTMLLGVPLLSGVIGDRSRFLATRLTAAVCIIPILAALPLTGSRGTLVAALIVAIYVFKRFSVGGKMGLLLLVAMTFLIIVPFLSQNLLDRYGTITSSDKFETTIETDSRVYLLEQGLILIAYHPIFGVGASMFPVAENDLAIEQGLRRGTWHTCHNMFIQIASEGGLPAIAIFLWILLVVWKTLTSLENLRVVSHPSAVEIRRLAFWTKITFLSFCACGLFLSIGMSNTCLMWISIPLALGRVVSIEMRQQERDRESEEPSQDTATATHLDRITPILDRNLRVR